MTEGNRHYRNGAAFERRVKARLEEQGWTCFRTAGSHSPADLIAFRVNSHVFSNVYSEDGLAYGHCIKCGSRDDGSTTCGSEVRFVQCKGGVRPMPRADKARFKEFANNLGAKALVVSRGMKEELL